MALRNYNVQEDAITAAAAGTIPAGYVVCLSSDLTGYVVATTANRAALTAATGVTATLAGIAIGTGVAGATFPIVGSGHVDASYVGTLSGSGQYVDCNASGLPERSSAVGVNTIGIYAPDGSVEVNTTLQSASATGADYGYILLSSYGATNAALALADTAAQATTPTKTILVTQQVTLTANITVSSPMRVVGGSFTSSSAYTLTVAHSFKCERVRCIYGSVTLAWQNGHQQDELFPEWWGADPTGYLCNGVTVAAGLTLASGDATVGGSGFASTHVGKICCVFEQTGSDAFRSTVASVTSSSELELAANSTANITTASGSQVWIGTDSYTALRAAIVASRGEIYVSLTPDGEYGVATQLDPRPSANGLRMRGNGAWIRWCGTAGTGKVFSTDDGLDTNGGGRSGCHITDLNVSACNLVNDAIYMANETYPKRGRGMAGTWRNVRAMHALRYGHYHHCAQVSVFDTCYAQFFGSVGWTAIACNSSALRDCRASNPHTASADAIVVDSYPQGGGGGGGDGYGGGDIVATNFIAEVVTGRGIVVLDTGGSSGTVVEFAGGHLEGIQEDGIYVDRENTLIHGMSVTGPGGTTYYPFRVSGNAHGTKIRDLAVGTYGTSQLGGIVETGATHVVIESNYVAGSDNRVDPTVTDIWPGKLHLRHGAGDVYAQGKLFVGTSAITPTHSIQVESGSLLLDKGHVLQTLGQVSNAYGGIGIGVNGLVQSETFGTTWTASSCTVTSNAAAGPYGGTVADQLTLTAASGLLRQPVTAATMGGLTIIGSTFIFSVWARAVSGTATVRMYLINQQGGAEANGNTFSDWTLTTAWRRVWVAWTSTSTGAPDAIRCGIHGAGATYDIYAWGAQLEYYSADSGLDQRHPGPYAMTKATARTVACAGPVFNAPPVVPGGTFTCGAAATTTVNDTRVTTTSVIRLMPTNAAAATLMGAATSLYVSARTAATSFAVTTANAAAAAGTETFEYTIEDRWSL